MTEQRSAQWVPHRGPNDQQTDAFRRWIEEHDVPTEPGSRITVAGIGWHLTPDEPDEEPADG